MRLLQSLFLVCALLASSVSAQTEPDARKAVFDLVTDDPQRIQERIIDTIKELHEHYAAQGVEFKAVVVISGKAYKFFVDDIEQSPYRDDSALIALQEKFRPAFGELSERYGVRFDMCGVGMKAKGIEADSVYPFVNTDKSKYIYLVDWQNAGYAYIPI